MAMMVEKRNYFATTFVSMRSKPAEKFQVVKGLLHSDHVVASGERSVFCSDHFANYFAGKIDCICLDLDSGFDFQMYGAVCLVLLYGISFHLHSLRM